MFNIIVCPIKRGIRFCENMNIHIKKNQNLGIAFIVALLLVSFCGVLALSESSEASATDPLISGVTGTAGTDTLEVTIGATIVNATTITIDYGDESVAATVTATDDVISSTYTYATAGTYTVTITATDGTVTDTATASYVTSTGVWTNNYTVTFSGIEDVAAQTVASGSFATVPTLTSTTGTITWLTDPEDATTIFDFETTAITADITLYYHFVANASTSDGLLADIVGDLGWTVIGGIIASVILGIIAAAFRFENPYADLLVAVPVVFTVVCWYYDITTFGAIWEQIKTFVDGLF